MNKFQEWAAKRRPKPKVEQKSEVELIELTPEEELAEAWEEWKIAFKWPIRVFKIIVFTFITILVLHAWAVNSIVNDCYLDKECKQWIMKER